MTLCMKKKTRIIIALISILSILYMIRRAHIKQKRFQKLLKKVDVPHSKKKGPVIAFGGGGVLLAYFLGVAVFLREHFDLVASDATFTGVSAGCFGAMALFFNKLGVAELFYVLQLVCNWCDQRYLGWFFMNPKSLQNILFTEFKKFGIDQKYMQKQNKKYGENSIYFGVSAVDLIGCRLHPMQIHSFSSIKQLWYAALCSMRVLPFFYMPGLWNKYLCVDGGFTRNVALSEFDKKHREIIKVQVECLSRGKSADIITEKNTFSLKEAFSNNLSFEQNIERFKIGYQTASKLKTVQKLIQKGLKWNNSENKTKFESETAWNKHIQKKINKHESKMLSFFALKFGKKYHTKQAIESSNFIKDA